MIEEWRPIVGYEGLYEVSSWGRIKNRHGKLRKQRIDRYGYQKVNLSKNGIYKTFLVHRLVAQVFIPNPNNYHIINHKDYTPLNNRVDNLEWCDTKYNVNYGDGNIKREKSAIKTPIIQMDLNGNILKIFRSFKEAKRNGFNMADIYLCCQGKRKTHKGYKWKYK